LQEVEQRFASRGHDVLGGLAQGDFNQRGGLDADVEQIGGQPANGAHRRIGVGGATKHFLHARAKALLTPDQFVEQ